MSERNIEIVREYNFDPKEVIAGLNGYYESDKRNGYITVKRNDVEGPAYLAAALYLSALIEWLREDHDIFYRPGLIFDQIEAAMSAAKMCCLRAHIKDEISKRGLWCGADEDIPELVDTLFKAYDECVERANKNRKDAAKLSKEIRCVVNEKESAIEKLKERIAELESNFKAVCDEDDIFRTRALKAEEEVKKLKEQLDKATADYQALSEENKKLKESGIEDLKEHITLLEADLKKAKMEKEKFLIEVADRDEEIESLQKKGADLYSEHRHYIVNGIMNDIRQEASRCGFDLPEKVDGAPLSIGRTFHDLLELLKKRTAEIKEVNDKRWKDLRDINKVLGYDGTYDNIDNFATAVMARAECVKRALGEKSDINKLIRDYCTKNNIIAPSRYFSDKACVEYLFSVVDLKQKDRSFTILQDLYRDIFKRQPNGLSAEDIANKILDRMVETDSPAAQRGKIRAEIENYKLKLKDYILKDIKEHGYRYGGLENKSIEEIVDWIITMATLDCSNIALRDIYTTVASPVERRRYNIDDCDVAIVDHMKDYILRRFEGLRINIEYCLKKMSELDGCQKDLKILEEQQEFLVKQNSELATKVSAKDDEISRLKGLINAMNEEVRDM